VTESLSNSTIRKPWGSETVHHLGRYCVKELFMKAGEECSLQYHVSKEETIIAFSGRLEVSFGESAEKLETLELKSGETLHLAPGTVHQMRAIEDSLYFEASTPELDDVIRISDKYGR